MFSRFLTFIVLVAVLLIGWTPSASAQESATIQALATVISSLSIVGINNLQFGNVTPGVAKAVNKATPGFAGQWDITGTPGAEITIDFTLPDSIVQVADSTIGMPIQFNATDASWDDGTGGQLTPTGVIDPNGLSTQRIGIGGMINIWLGGSVFPRVSQGGGDYAEDVILTVAYTGS